VDFWNFLISCKAFVPGRNLYGRGTLGGDGFGDFLVLPVAKNPPDELDELLLPPPSLPGVFAERFCFFCIFSCCFEGRGVEVLRLLEDVPDGPAVGDLPFCELGGLLEDLFSLAFVFPLDSLLALDSVDWG